MDLNIDITGVLLPNFSTVIIQWLAAGVLFYFMKKYLWKAARDWTKKRQDYMQKQVEIISKNTSDSERELKEAKAKVKAAVGTSKEIISKAEKDSYVRKNEILREAEAEAQQRLSKAEAEIENKKRLMQKDMVKEMVTVAMAASEKLLEAKVDSTTDQKEIERFVKEIRS